LEENHEKKNEAEENFGRMRWKKTEENTEGEIALSSR